MFERESVRCVFFFVSVSTHVDACLCAAGVCVHSLRLSVLSLPSVGTSGKPCSRGAEQQQVYTVFTQVCAEILFTHLYLYFILKLIFLQKSYK